jgi:Fe-S cluster biogenesis protein NfuA
MIRSAIKGALKRALGMEQKPVAEPPPPPAWRTDARVAEPTVKVEAPPVVASVDPRVEPAPAAASAEAVTDPPVEAVAEAAPAPAAEPAPTPARKSRKKKVEPEVEAAVEPAAGAAPPEPVVAAAPPEPAPADDTVGPPAFSMEQVQELFDEMVRPALQGDGGDIRLIRIEGNDVYVKLVGSCSTCPSSILTMKMGVEALLKEELPGFGSLIQVD